MRVLVVSQYPIRPALHGGQKRTAAILAYYQQRCTARHVAIYWPGMYDPQDGKDSDNLLVTEQSLINQLHDHPERSEVLLAGALSPDSEITKKIKSIIKTFRPDIVHVEQPYLVPSIKVVLSELGVSSVLIHGSQNVEYLLKRDIYQGRLPAKDINYLEKKTRIIEENAIKQADLNICVSKADASIFRKKDFPHFKRWLVVPNGTDYRKPSHMPGEEEYGANPIFIGSAHPPNYIGIESLMMDTSYLETEQPLLIIGSVADYLRHTYASADPFWRGKEVVGKVAEQKLYKYVEHADTIVLPIVSGGGSNLKTAEAIYAHKKIVGTDFSFRGYEKFKSYPNVFIANTPTEFKDQLLKATHASVQDYTPRQERLIEHLSWHYVLKSLSLCLFYARIHLFLRWLRIKLPSV